MSEFVSGALAALTADACLHPLDNAKCLYQTHGNANSLWLRPNTAIRSLYRGYAAVAIASGPGNGVFYWTYDVAGQELRNLGLLSDSGVVLASSALATVAASTVYAPMEVVKETCFVDLCTTRQAVYKVYGAGGARAFFRGWKISVSTWLPYMSLYFGMFEKLKAGASSSGDRSDIAAWRSDFGHGLVAGGVSAAVTYPLDVIKTKVQSGVSEMPLTLSTAYNTAFQGSSWQTILRGVGLRMVWLAPSSALILSFQQMYSRWLKG